MAGEWIPMRVDILDDPAVISIAASCDLNEYEVVGRLFRLWCWANRQLSNGDAAGVTEKWVDRHVGVTGFAQAMSAAGWLVLGAGGVSFPNFDRWNSKCSKRRLLTSQRMKTLRTRDANSDAASVTQASPEESRVEKSKKNTPLPPTGGDSVKSPKPKPPPKESAEAVPLPAELDTPEFRTTWVEWIAERKDRKKPLTARAAKNQLAVLAGLGPVKAAETVSASIRNGWAGLFPESDTAKANSPRLSFRQSERAEADALQDALTIKPATFDALPEFIEPPELEAHDAAA